MDTGSGNSNFDWDKFHEELEEFNSRFKGLFLGPKDEVPAELVEELLAVHIKLTTQQLDLLESQEVELAEQKDQLIALVENQNFWLYVTMVQNLADKIKCNEGMLARNAALIETFNTK